MKLRIKVVEEVMMPGRPAVSRARPDLHGVARGYCPPGAKRSAIEGIKKDPRFNGLQVISTGFEDRGTLHVVVRRTDQVVAYKVPGVVSRKRL